MTASPPAPAAPGPVGGGESEKPKEEKDDDDDAARFAGRAGGAHRASTAVEAVASVLRLLEGGMCDQEFKRDIDASAAGTEPITRAGDVLPANGRNRTRDMG